MTEYQLSNDELNLLGELEEEAPAPAPKKRGRKKAIDLDNDSAAFIQLQQLCAKATEVVTKAYGKCGCEGFEVASGCVLPYVDGSGSENFVGMESLTFKKLIPTRHKGGILAVFGLGISRPDVAVWVDDLPTVFGRRGLKLKDYFDSPVMELSKKRAEIMDNAVIIDRAAEYKENEDYGTW